MEKHQLTTLKIPLTSPFEERPEQSKAIDSILKELEHHNIVFLYAPTGSGKSLINLKVAIHSGGAYITTPQTTLVNQYDRDLKGKFVNMGHAVMGRKNYPCPYLKSLMRLGDSRVPLDPSIARMLSSPRYLSPASAFAPCTSPSPSFVSNLPHLLEEAEDLREIRREFGGRVKLPEPLKPSMAKECAFLSACPYYTARNRAMEDSVTVTTFHYFERGILSSIKRDLVPSLNRSPSAGDTHPATGNTARVGTTDPEWNPNGGNATESRKWKKRNLLIIDEAHNLPDFLVNFFTVSASSRWPRFDYFNFQVADDGARDSHPNDMSNATFKVFREWFLGYHAQEENRLVKLNEARRKIAQTSAVQGEDWQPWQE